MTRAQRAEMLVEKNQNLARSLVTKLRVPGYLRDECEAEAWLALHEAALRFRRNRGAKFATFAYYRVKGAICDVLNRNSKIDKSNTRAHAEAAYSRPCPPDAAIDLKRILSKLDPLDRALLEAYFLEGRWMHEIKAFSKSWVSRRIKRALERAREATE